MLRSLCSGVWEELGKPMIKHGIIADRFSKTQIALKFAQTVRNRMSVYWVRADAFTNFAADYVQVLKEIDPINAARYQNADLQDTLQRARRRLESISDT